MCGIAGGTWSDGRLALDQTTLDRMVGVLTHRGPDDLGTYLSATTSCPVSTSPSRTALGVRRLAIIDVPAGHQPVGNEDGSIWVVFNGEIYNHRDLRRQLIATGHTFRTHCDTESLVHLYEEQGLDFVHHLNGMFAIAIWDIPRNRLILARDRLGQKPLVYSREPGRLLFASEIKSLLEVPGLSRKVRPTAVDQFLTYQYIPHPGTIWEGIEKLPPAHLAIYANDELTIERYWSPNENQASAPRDFHRQLRSTLTQAVEYRLQSEVPLGAFLSGGIDSSILVALMREVSSQRVQTFSIGFEFPQYDETAYAIRVSEHLGTEHHVLEVGADATEIVESLAWHYDEPFGDSSAIPTWYLAEKTRQHVTVALSGDGGDELFLGYPRYRAVQLAAGIDRLPRALRKLAAGRFWQLIPYSRRGGSTQRFCRFTGSLGLRPDLRYLDWISIFDELSKNSLYTEDFLLQLHDSQPAAFLSQAWRGVSDRDAVTTAATTDLQTYLPCDLLTKVDIATMAHSLECRQPFLDHQVVELAMAMPTELKFRRGRGKQILRETFGDLLPGEVFRRPKKGFGVPLDCWFRKELQGMAEDILLHNTCIERGLFRKEAIRQLLNDHCTSRRDHSDRLWALLMLELWYREWVDR